MTRGAVHGLDQLRSRATDVLMGVHSVSLNLRSTCPQHWSASSTNPKRRVPPDAVRWAAASFDFIFIFLSSLLFIAMPPGIGNPATGHSLTFFGIAIVFAVLAHINGAYRNRRLQNTIGQVKNVLAAWILTIGTTFCFVFTNPTVMEATATKRLWIWLVGVPLLLAIYKWIYNYIYCHLVGGGYIARNIVILGAGDHAAAVIRKMQSSEAQDLYIRGLFDDRKSRTPAAIGGVPVLGTTDDLIEFVRREIVDEVVIALPIAACERITSLSRKLQALAIDVRLSIEPSPVNFGARTVDYLGDLRVLDLVDRPFKGWRGILKNFQDKLLSVIFLVCATPLMLVIALLIKLKNQGPVFFVQERFGLNNSRIRVLKFRTMHLSCGDLSGQRRTIKNDPRVTRAGRILRRFSLDELPQLINVIRGDMSLVGPRPHAVAMMAGDQFYHEAVEEYPRRHRVKPGITGWAQVNGSRGEIDTLAKARDRVRLDLDYIERWSLWLDIKILFKTVSLLVCKTAY